MKRLNVGNDAPPPRIQVQNMGMNDPLDRRPYLNQLPHSSSLSLSKSDLRMSVATTMSNDTRKTTTSRTGILGSIAPKATTSAAKKQNQHPDIYYDTLENVLYHRGIQPDYMSQLTTLDLTDCHLKEINMAPFFSLRTLILSDNYIDSPAWLTSNIVNLFYLETLDIRNNFLEALQMICDTISNLVNLSSLLVDGNPCFLEDNQENRYLLIAKTPPLQTTNCKLRYLNGSLIAIDERIECNKYAAEPKPLIYSEKLRMTLILEQFNLNVDTRELDFSGQGIRIITNVLQFKNVKYLNLSMNRIHNLVGCELDGLPNLADLDLSDNQIDDLDRLLGEIKKLHKLRILTLKNNNLPKGYAQTLFLTLRAVEMIDGERNRQLLSERQLKACGYLLKLAKNDRSRVSANNCLNINLAGLNLESEHFVKTVKALSILPMVNNPWANLLNYRLLVIYYVKTLKDLDGERISFEDRANAIRIFNEFQDRLVSEGSDSKDPATGLPNAKEKVLERALDSTNSDRKDMVYVGGILTKVEIAINYFQISGLLLSMTEYEPNFLRILITFLNFFSFFINIDFQKYKGLIITLPCLAVPIIFAMYFMKINRNRWSRIFVTNWKPTLLIIFLIWVLMIVSFALLLFGLLSDSTTSPGGSSLGRDIGFGVGVLILTNLFAFFIVVGISVRKNYQSESYWYSVLRIKRRIALFLMTIIYMPVNKLILQYFRTCSATNLSPEDYLKCMSTSPAQPSPTKFSEFPGLWWFLIPLSIFFVSFLPIFFAHIIRNGVKQILLNYGVGEELSKLNDKEKEFKDLKQRRANKDEIQKYKKDIHIATENIKSQYALSIQKHESASAYLFASFRVNCHYWKPFLMAQRLLLCLINLFVFEGATKSTVGLVVCVIGAIATISWQPFTDPVENLLEVFSQALNSLTILIVMLLERNTIGPGSEWLADTIFLATFVIFTICFVVACGSTAIRKKALQERIANTAAKDKRQKGRARTELTRKSVLTQAQMTPSPGAGPGPDTIIVQNKSESTQASDINTLYKEFTALAIEQDPAFEEQKLD